MPLPAICSSHTVLHFNTPYTNENQKTIKTGFPLTCKNGISYIEPGLTIRAIFGISVMYAVHYPHTGSPYEPYLDGQ